MTPGSWNQLRCVLYTEHNGGLYHLLSSQKLGPPPGLLRGGLGAYAPYKLMAAPQVDGVTIPGTLCSSQQMESPKLRIRDSPVVGLCSKAGLTSVDK